MTKSSTNTAPISSLTIDREIFQLAGEEKFTKEFIYQKLKELSDAHPRRNIEVRAIQTHVTLDDIEFAKNKSKEASNG